MGSLHEVLGSKLCCHCTCGTFIFDFVNFKIQNFEKKHEEGKGAFGVVIHGNDIILGMRGKRQYFKKLFTREGEEVFHIS